MHDQDCLSGSFSSQLNGMNTHFNEMRIRKTQSTKRPHDTHSQTTALKSRRSILLHEFYSSQDSVKHNSKDRSFAPSAANLSWKHSAVLQTAKQIQFEASGETVSVFRWISSFPKTMSFAFEISGFVTWHGANR